MSQLAREQESFLDYAIEEGAFKLGDFTLKNGRNSPWFWNAGSFVGTGRGLKLLGDAYAKIIFDNKGLETDFVIGPAEKGNDISSATVLELYNYYAGNFNRIVDRKTPKYHGEATQESYWGNWFYGTEPQKGARIWMVDDVLTTAGTKRDLLIKLSKHSKLLTYKGLIITVDRQELNDDGISAVEEFSEDHMDVYSIVNAQEIYSYISEPEVFDKLKELGRAKDGDLERFKDYLLTYGTDELKDSLEAK
ncbi:MAG: hypothetical protein GOV01_03085 [Candidatus Altiarchaeota archaeon]|nr:hypothetical protein [Candidatus Altiarchaeota archaeon]